MVYHVHQPLARETRAVWAHQRVLDVLVARRWADMHAKRIGRLAARAAKRLNRRARPEARP